MRFPHSVVLRWGSLDDVRHGMEGFCCGVDELEISSGVAPQQTEVRFFKYLYRLFVSIYGKGFSVGYL